MSLAPRPRRLLVLGDSPAFCRTVATLLKAQSPAGSPVAWLTFRDAPAHYTPQLQRTLRLVVVELWRRYATGYRAEGITVAQSCLAGGILPLILSPLSLAGRWPQLDLYWDLASPDPLPARVAALLSSPPRVPGRGLLEPLCDFLAPYLAVPTGHDDGLQG